MLRTTRSNLHKCFLSICLCMLLSFALIYCPSKLRIGKCDCDNPAATIALTAVSEKNIAAALNLLRRGRVQCNQVQALFPDRIPPVIHWTNRDSNVLLKHRDLVLSWPSLLGKSAAYMLWDDAKIERLLIRHYPELWQRYKYLGAGIMRSDIGRLAIVHHVGGVYTDMDVRLLRNFLPLLRNHTSLWSQEPWEHAHYLYGRQEMLSNALFMSRAGHPFLDYVLRIWPGWFDDTWLSRPGLQLSNSMLAVAMTGPGMLNQFLDTCRQAAGNATPTLAKPDAFQPWWDDTTIPFIARKQCAFTAIMSTEQRRRCLEIPKVKFVSRNIPPDSYSVHLYLHTGYGIPLNYSGAKQFDRLINASSCIV